MDKEMFFQYSNEYEENMLSVILYNFNNINFVKNTINNLDLKFFLNQKCKIIFNNL